MNNEAVLMPLISSCSIACGGHTGDQASMQNVLKLAVEHGVKIGAHPSYPDQKNFGRKVLDISNTDLLSSLIDQIQSLQTIADSFKVKLNHVKPHGALYNVACNDTSLAEIILTAMESFDKGISLYAPAHSIMSKMAQQRNIPVIYEAFADRAYTSNLSLVSRAKEGALLTNSEDVFRQVNSIVNGQVMTIDNELIDIKAETICIHSDTENADKLIEQLVQDCARAGITIL